MYDNYGNIKDIVGPLGITTSATYDLAGRLKTRENPNDEVTTYDYDHRDYLEKITDPLGHITRFFYDGNENMTSVVNALGNTTTLEYDYFDWLKSMTFDGATKSYDYDDEGKLTALHKPGGATLQHTYNAKGCWPTTATARLRTTPKPAGHGRQRRQNHCLQLRRPRSHYRHYLRRKNRGLRLRRKQQRNPYHLPRQQTGGVHL
ncbi:MAG: RHS repeat protein [Saprospiraceae bacterium]|nr:RHS repeat protein [Saprospiraceae bacterium]